MAEFVVFEDILCSKCGVKMELGRTDFKYLGHNFHTEVMRCPQCGAVYIPEELAEGISTVIYRARFSVNDEGIVRFLED